MPMVKTKYSIEYYSEKGELHREDGPAIEYLDGDKEWYQNGKCHRLDGPAIEYTSGTKIYYINDLSYPKEEYYRLIKLKGFWE